MKTYNIAVIPGDGIGKEVTREGIKILNALSDKYGFKAKTENFDWSCDYYLKHGEMGPENVLDILKGFDAIFPRLHWGCQQGAGPYLSHPSA